MGTLCTRQPPDVASDGTAQEMAHLHPGVASSDRRCHVQPNSNVVRQTELYEALASKTVLEQLRLEHERFRFPCPGGEHGAYGSVTMAVTMRSSVELFSQVELDFASLDPAFIDSLCRGDTQLGRYEQLGVRLVLQGLGDTVTYEVNGRCACGF